MKNKHIPRLWACVRCVVLVIGASGLLRTEQARAEPPELLSLPQEANSQQEQGKPDPEEKKPAKKVDFVATIKTYLRYGGVDEKQDAQNKSAVFSPVRQEFGLDIYEATFGVKASLPLYRAWGVQVAGALDLVDFTQLSDRVYLPRHYDSGAVREASMSLYHKTFGRLTVDLTEGIDAKFGLGGHSDLAASGGLDGDFKNTRWAAADIGYALGRVGSENFPKIQYLSSKLSGFQFGLEWFTNAQSPDNKANNLKLDPKSIIRCPIAEPLYFPRNAKSNSEFCWRLSPNLDRWNPKAKRAIQGGGIGMSYTYEHKDTLSLSLAARYGIVFEDAQVTDRSNDGEIYKVNLQEQAAGAGVSLRWNRYRFAIGGNLLFPSRYNYERVGGARGSDPGTYGWSWSMSTSILGFHTKKRKKSDSQQPPKGTFSVAVAQGEIREHPEKDLGKTFLFSAGFDYPIGDHVFVLFDYWYGDVVFFHRRIANLLPDMPLYYTGIYDTGISLEHAVVFGLRTQF